MTFDVNCHHYLYMAGVLFIAAADGTQLAQADMSTFYVRLHAVNRIRQQNSTYKAALNRLQVHDS